MVGSYIILFLFKIIIKNEIKMCTVLGVVSIASVIPAEACVSPQNFKKIITFFQNSTDMSKLI